MRWNTYYHMFCAVWKIISFFLIECSTKKDNEWATSKCSQLKFSSEHSLQIGRQIQELLLNESCLGLFCRKVICWFVGYLPESWMTIIGFKKFLGLYSELPWHVTLERRFPLPLKVSSFHRLSWRKPKRKGLKSARDPYLQVKLFKNNIL